MIRKQNGMNQFNNRNDEIVVNFAGNKKVKIVKIVSKRGT